ncbi:hypothetical protein DVG78_27365 [Runella aurantiaca]|uniref:Uncharacterized protein n=1 Tax=Runella aurantiaca TaxID=2282308 RepID=A0A369I2L7_9BACT|nr:hypothetical protein DVG78_27365 [Runella aurantiaca]
MLFFVTCRNTRINYNLHLVKKAAKLIGFLGILTLYSFVLSLYSGNVFVNHSADSQLADSQSKHSSSVQLPELFCLTAHAEISVAPLQSPSPPRPENFLNRFLAWYKTAEQLFETTFSQYSFYSLNLLVRLERTDIIFPFHYFW